MLLTIDLGNTCIKLGLFEDKKQISFSYIPTYNTDYQGQILSFIYKSMVREDQITDIIMSSVVPKVRDELVEIIQTLFNKDPIEIDYKNDYGIKLLCDNPSEVGNDLIVMMSYCHFLFKENLLICSLGSCSVICYVSSDGSFRNCIIAPGFVKMQSTLSESGALLPNFAKEKRNSFIATNTIDAMNVGFYNGYIGMIEYLILKLKRELGVNCRIIACGGETKEIGPYTKIFNYADPDLVTKGLNFIYLKYYKK